MGTYFICTTVSHFICGVWASRPPVDTKSANAPVSYINGTEFAYRLHLLYAVIIPGLLIPYNVHAMKKTARLCKAKIVSIWEESLGWGPHASTHEHSGSSKERFRLWNILEF